jgi:hypothetical protein
MSKLSDDILFVIFEELQEKNNLYSCLTVNKNWCKITVLILWRNPWKTLKKKKDKFLLNVIISHLSDETKINLRRNHELDFLTDSYRKPLFDYISFCRHLNFNKIERVIKSFHDKTKLSIINNEMIKLFVNENNRNYTHLYISYQFDYPLHLIPGASRCFSGIHYLNCSTSIKDSLSAGLTEICKSIKVLDIFIEARDNNIGIVELIKVQKNLSKISLTTHSYNEEFFCEYLENSLIEHVNTVRYFKLTKRSSTKIISSFVHLRELEVNGCVNDIMEMDWNYLENVSLPSLEILRVSKIPFNALKGLIEGTSGFLNEIRIDNVDDERRIIQVIHRKCPKLQYLKLMLSLSNAKISELEKLLIKCQYLDGLFITGNVVGSLWDKLFSILTKSSPINLFKFKFSDAPKLESLKLFFDKWRDRHPMLLQFGYIENVEDLIEEYKAKGIVKMYNNNVSFGEGFEGFEWI